jgi:hypothetical protein
VALVIMDRQPTYFPDIFEPGYISGEHSVINPLTGAEYGAYGLTVTDANQRSDEMARLWTRKQPSFGSGYSLRKRHRDIPERETL